MEQNEIPEGSDQKPEVKDPGQDIKGLVAKKNELLAEAKAEREKRRALEEKLQAIEQEKLESQGKYADINQTLKKQLEDYRSKLSEKENKFKLTNIENALRLEAQRAGFKKPEAIRKFLDKSDLETITIDDEYNVDTDSVKMAIERVRTEFEDLFKNQIPTKDVPPNSSGFTMPSKSVSEMTKEELLQSLRE